MNSLSFLDLICVGMASVWLVAVLWVCMAKGGRYGDE